MALTGYLIVSADNRDALEVQVLEKAAEGYVPYGASYSVERKFMQTMVIGDVAGGGGSEPGATTFRELTDIDFESNVVNAMLFCSATGDPPSFTMQGANGARFESVMFTYLSGLPGFAAGFDLKVNAGGD